MYKVPLVFAESNLTCPSWNSQNTCAVSCDHYFIAKIYCQYITFLCLAYLAYSEINKMLTEQLIF